MEPKFILGIDLGTSNSAVTLVDLAAETSRVLEVSQIMGPNQIGEKSTLPSALYLPHANEFPPEAIRLPWESPEAGVRPMIVGDFARRHGGQTPERLLVSAKSWLSHPHVDPTAAILPWGSTIEEGKLSPFEASRRYLEHLREGFLHAERREGRTWDLAEGQIVITVPASFDEAARRLTADAAQAAGMGEVILLEEPQAAFYAWTEQAGADWRQQVTPGDIVLVCDVGGGTADFSLLAVSEVDGNLSVERIAVGEHLLLGGDNLDLALAYTLQAQLEDEGKTIDEWQFRALIHAASEAKIALFSDDSLESALIAVPSRGSGLFAGTVSTQLPRATLEAVALDGFFARTTIDDLPAEGGGSALQEFGLDYASDPVVSKHLARFLRRARQNVETSESLRQLVGARPEVLTANFLKPTAVLFNGGVFKAAPLRRRVLEILGQWTGGETVRELAGFQPDLAVAQGAAFYGRNRATGKGIRIKAGTARSYYVGLETAGPAIPGFKPALKALCVVPQGMEEGSEHLIAEKTFAVVTGKPAVFRFFGSEIRGGDKPGDLVPNAEKVLEEGNRIEVTLPPMEEFPSGQPIPVQLHSRVTELGNLELWMKHTASEQRWKVEFAVRME
jgi:molecular chaperone DnaK (HSP70)